MADVRVPAACPRRSAAMPPQREASPGTSLPVSGFDYFFISPPCPGQCSPPRPCSGLGSQSEGGTRSYLTWPIFSHFFINGECSTLSARKQPARRPLRRSRGVTRVASARCDHVRVRGGRGCGTGTVGAMAGLVENILSFTTPVTSRDSLNTVTRDLPSHRL